jgi:hypothetical protein
MHIKLQMRPRASFRSDTANHGAVLLRMPAATGGGGVEGIVGIIRENSGKMFTSGSPTVKSSLNRPSVGHQNAQSAADAASAAIAQENSGIQVRFQLYIYSSMTYVTV